MLIVRGLHSPDSSPLAVTIGNFDGVHLGHQAMLHKLRHEAAMRGLQSSVIVFEPHPREFFAPDSAPVRLTNLREKLEQFAVLGVDRVQVCRFDQRFAAMSPEAFIHALHDKLNARYVLIGDDFRFGSGRSGDFAQMEKIGDECGFAVDAMHSVMNEDVRISSTAVRLALAHGDLRTAQRYLGRPYSISGRVVHGDAKGRQLGYPTANIQMRHNRAPLTGVFVVRARLEGGDWLRGVASLGVRPTLKNDNKPVLEVHLFDFDEQIYDRHLHVDFLHKLRDEKKFAGLDALVEQIALDAAQAKEWFVRAC